MTRSPSSNAEAIRVTLEIAKSGTPADRWFAVRSLGELARLKNGNLRRAVLTTLQTIADDDQESPELRWITHRSINEIHGDLDKISEKYKPQEPNGTLSDQYYLKRG